MKRCFGGALAGRRVLVTGHTGFKGSWLALWLAELGAEVAGYALDAPSDPNHLAIVRPACRDERGDVADAVRLGALVEAYRPEVVLHLAAQPLVRRSYRDTRGTYLTNVLGTVNVLEAVRAVDSVRAVVVVTSDKVYRNHEWPWGYRETDELGGHDPYSASKSCTELVAHSYRETVLTRPGLLLATVRAGNVVGGGDWAEDRLIPDLVRGAVSGSEVEIRHPRATRPWQHVLEPLSGYLVVAERLLAGDASAAAAWNFGPREEAHASVERVLGLCAERWDRIRWRLGAGAQGMPESMLLHLDVSAALHRLKWAPVWDLAHTLDRTIGWYREHAEQGDAAAASRSRADLAAYVADARAAGIAWAAPVKVV
jgi:CDP-glucose 4,6-dehydratase